MNEKTQDTIHVGVIHLSSLRNSDEFLNEVSYNGYEENYKLMEWRVGDHTLKVVVEEEYYPAEFNECDTLIGDWRKEWMEGKVSWADGTKEKVQKAFLVPGYDENSARKYGFTAIFRSNGYIQVLQSERVAMCRPCSPCYPNQGDLETKHDGNGNWKTYDLPEDYN